MEGASTLVTMGSRMGTETQCGGVRLDIGTRRGQRIGGRGPEEAITAREVSTVMRTGRQDEGQTGPDFYGALAKHLAPC